MAENGWFKDAPDPERSTRYAGYAGELFHKLLPAEKDLVALHIIAVHADGAIASTWVCDDPDIEIMLPTILNEQARRITKAISQ